MDNKDSQLIASNLTLAFYNGQVKREPFFGDDRRLKFYSPDDQSRIPTISIHEVYAVYEKFCELVRNDD